MCSMSACNGNEFLEISFLEIGGDRGSHLLGNPSLFCGAVLCCGCTSDKGNQSCCKVVSASFPTQKDTHMQQCTLVGVGKLAGALRWFILSCCSL